MPNLRQLIILGSLSIILLLGGFLVWYFSPSQVVQRQLKSFLKSTTFEAGEGPMLRSFQTDRFVGHIAKQVTITAPISEINRTLSESSMRSGHQYLVTQAKHLYLGYDSISVRSITNNEAELVTILNLDAKVKSHEQYRMKLLSVFHFIMTEEGWKIDKMSFTEQ